MTKDYVFARHGLFDLQVPRYTSYPPANRFEPGVGQERQTEWLAAVEPDQPVSVYVHIPFCRRLCWFCACRTQGTQTLRPVEDYVVDVLTEIDTVVRRLPRGTKMARLHLGGGTPTLLSPALMDRLLHSIFDRLPKGEAFEFSVEIDPTEAAPEILACLTKWGMNRASIGVQDFAPRVQKAIGRPQSFAETARVAGQLRSSGVKSLNFDLLYGLPFQTERSLLRTLDQVRTLNPDRLALYGYAHVPHMSKRQVMVDSDQVPDPRQRLRLFDLAEEVLTDRGYLRLGLDHFARPGDSLAQAAAQGVLRRNFQGHTDDPCETLLGFGASAISRFRQGYAQNAVSTAAYRERVQNNGFAAHKGYQMTDQDRAISDMIERLICDCAIDIRALSHKHPTQSAFIAAQIDRLVSAFGDVLTRTASMVVLAPQYYPLSRIMAAHLDSIAPVLGHHSTAI